MISTKQPDGSFVTSPLFVGTNEAVEKMKTCQHQYKPATPISDAPEGQFIMMERCRCGAARARHADSREVLEKYQPGE